MVYGGGAVGLGVASCLLKSGIEVDIIGRKGTVEALRRDGLRRTGIFGDFDAGPASFGAYVCLDQTVRGIYDFILVCTKSFDSHNAAKDISEHGRLLGENTVVVLFQNGWGNAEVFCSFFDKARIYNARVITGFSRQEKNVVDVTVHADSIHIGSLYGADATAVEALCESIGRGGIPCVGTAEIGKDLWAKMLYNCALNALGAILDVPYGVLAEHESTRAIMRGIVEEVFEVMAAAGCRTHWSSPSQFLELFYRKLVPDTANHKSSTLQDIIAKKRTEIDALNGAVIKLGHEHGVSVAYNTVVYDIVRFIESGASGEVAS